MPDNTPPPIASMDPNANWDPNIETSAIYALRSLDPKAGIEQAGIIYQNPEGKYAGSIPITQNQRDAFALRAQLPKGYKIGGIYHAHPSDDPESQYFSPQDVEMAEKLKVPSYILFQHDGSIRSYTPGKTATRHMQIPGDMKNYKIADGDHINVSDDLARKIQVMKAYAAQQKDLQSPQS